MTQGCPKRRGILRQRFHEFIPEGTITLPADASIGRPAIEVHVPEGIEVTPDIPAPAGPIQRPTRGGLMRTSPVLQMPDISFHLAVADAIRESRRTRTAVHVGHLFGLPVIVDTSVEPGVIELRSVADARAHDGENEPNPQPQED